MIKLLFLKIEKTLVKQEIFTFIFFSFLLLILLAVPFHLVKYFFDISSGNSIMVEKTIIEKVIIGIFIGPIIETLIFQTALINLSLFIKKNKLFAILVSALLFGLSHYYSFYYFTYTFTIGSFLSYLYFLSKKKKYNPILTLSSIHALYNLIVLATNL